VPDDSKDNYDSATSFLTANFQYVFVGVALAQSYGIFRERIVQNALLSATFLAQLAVISLFVLWPNEGLDAAFSLWPTPADFRLKLWLLGMGCGATFVLAERFLVPHQSPDEVRRRDRAATG